MVHTSDFKQRQPWIDIAKGIGITAVVLGHSGSSIAYYLYWFHMPLFFIISGYLFKPHEDWATLSNWLYKRTCQLLIPYLSFLIIIVTVEFYLGNRCFDAYKVASSFSLNFFPGGKFFAILGKYSLPVMYLHLPVNIILHNYFNYNYGYLSFALIGLVIPTLAGLIFDHFQLTRILLLGCSDIPVIPERIFSWRIIRNI